jgi:hypothetical protein
MHENHQGLPLPLPVTGHRPSGKGLRSLLVPGLLAAASVGIGGPAGAAALPADTAQSAAKAASLLSVREPLSGRTGAELAAWRRHRPVPWCAAICRRWAWCWMCKRLTDAICGG